MPRETKTEYEKRMKWFVNARFGMFIHWGLYSMLGRDAGALKFDAIPPREYESLADRFAPAPDCAQRWAALAKSAGAKYVVFVAKHHDGFCLFDSQLTGYTSRKHGAMRDYVREVVEAVRAEGLRIGLYYSLPDLHFPAYMAVASGSVSQQKPLQDFLHGHVRELLTNYGKIDVLWYDGPAFAGPMFEGGYLPPDIMDARGMNALARRLQPEIIINDRSMLPEDYSTPENVCRPAPYGRNWEMCICINDLWGYHPHDYNYKTVNQLIFLLVNCATQGGNLLLNIGPRGDGSVPEEQVERLQAIGGWLKVHGESVYGVERLKNPFFNSGRVTRKGGRLYFHGFYWPGKTMRIPDLYPGILQGTPGTAEVKAQVLTTGQPAEAHWDGDVLVISGLPATPPDRADTVVIVDVTAVG